MTDPIRRHAASRLSGLLGKSVSARLLWRNRAFRLLWLGDIVSGLGDWMTLVASATLLSQAAGPQSQIGIGVLFALRMLSPFVAATAVVPLLDECSKPLIMICSDLARAAVVPIFLLLGGSTSPLLIYMLSALQLGFSGVFQPAKTALVAEIVDSHDIPTANGLSASIFATTQALGAALGGVITGVLGATWTYLLDAGSFLLSAGLLASAFYPFDTSHPLDGADPGRGIMAGVRYIRNDHRVCFTVLQKAINAFFITGALNVLTVELATKRFSTVGSSFAIGSLMAWSGVGTAIGSIYARRVTPHHERAIRSGLFTAYLLSSLGLAMMTLSPGLDLAGGGSFIRGAGGGMMYVLTTSLLMLQAPPRVRGRLFGIEFALRSLASASGALLASIGLDSGYQLATLLYVSMGASLVPTIITAAWTLASKSHSRAEDRRPNPQEGEH